MTIAKALLTAARRPAKRTGPTLAKLLKATEIAHAIFGGRKLTHAGKLYIFDAQVYFGTLVVESALDGRDLWETP